MPLDAPVMTTTVPLEIGFMAFPRLERLGGYGLLAERERFREKFKGVRDWLTACRPQRGLRESA
ncbi:hypothetical protein GCM10027398_41800 [Azotobacter salinestris]